ncbi:MAG: L,D-transpeptidase family protein [Candidatus Magnetoovum sp. WYHC-5]|nr:L,D-transpeptidase family protein [Candidatus Magnetoovum sp. WYHC-5]
MVNLFFAIVSLLLLCACNPAGVRDERLVVMNKYFRDFASCCYDAEQIIQVKEIAGTNKASIIFYEKDRTNTWNTTLPPMVAVVGKNGIAGYGNKREGDGKTPSGAFPLSLVFGYEEHIQTDMPYRMATERDFWIDDPQHPSYNKWVTNTAGAKSFEKMKRNDNMYKYGIVIDYNVNPTVTGNGSAIFFHVWIDENTPTTGCIALRETDIIEIIKKLSPSKKPIALIVKE